MDQEDLKYLSDQAQQDYMEYVRLFESDTWKSLIDWVKNKVTMAAARQLAAQSWDQAVQAKGARLALEEIINLELEIENEAKASVEDARAKEIAEVEQEHE